MRQPTRNAESLIGIANNGSTNNGAKKFAHALGEPKSLPISKPPIPSKSPYNKPCAMARIDSINRSIMGRRRFPVAINRYLPEHFS